MRFSGGKPKSSSSVNSPDTFASQDTVELVLAVARGPIRGLNKGLKGVYLNNTALQNVDGSSNFGAVEVDVLTGATPFEQFPLSLGGIASSTTVNVQLASSVAVTRTLTQTNYDFIDFRFQIGQLMTQSSSGSSAAQLILKIEYKATASATWLPATFGGSIIPPPSTTVPYGNFRLEDTYDRQAPTRLTSVTTIEPIIATVGDRWVSPTNTFFREFNGSTWQDAGGTFASNTWTLPNKERFYNGGSTSSLPNVQPNDAVYNGTNVVEYNGVSWVNNQYNFDQLYPVVNLSGNNYGAAGILTVNEKISTTSVKEIRVPVPRIAGTYDVRVTKISPDSITDQLYSSVAWESSQAVLNKPLDMHGVAGLRFKARASDQFSSVPEITAEWDLLITKIPSNYNPVTRVYTGVWDGTWTTGFHNNPIWAACDMILDEIDGMSAAYPQTFDKWDAYDIARWCDESINDGMGGTRPRHTYNKIDTDGLDAAQRVTDILGSCNTRFIEDGSGNISFICDKDSNPVALFTLENCTTDGEFVYSYTDPITRANEVTVSFQNKDLDYQEDRRVVSQASTERIPDAFFAVGKTNASEAIAAAIYRLVTNLTETCSVTFATDRRAKYLGLWETILVADERQVWGLTHRVKSYTGTTLNLFEAVSLEVGITYQVTFEYVDSTTGARAPLVRTITSASGIRTSLTLSAALPTDLPANAAFTLSAASTIGVPRKFRVTSVSQKDPETFNVTAIQVNPLKHYTIENWSGTVYSEGSELLNSRAVTRVRNVKTEYSFLDNLVYLSWDSPAQGVIESYTVETSYTRAGPYTAVSTGRARQASFPVVSSFENLFYRITANPLIGLPSLPIEGIFNLDEVATRGPQTVVGPLPNPATVPLGTLYVDPAYPDRLHQRDMAGTQWLILSTVGARIGDNLRLANNAIAPSERIDNNLIAIDINGFLTNTGAGSKAVENSKITASTNIFFGNLDSTRINVDDAKRGFSTLLQSVSAAALTASWVNVTGAPLTLAALDAAANTTLTNVNSEVVAARGASASVGARIATEESARASADSALAGRATSLEAVTRAGNNISPGLTTWTKTINGTELAAADLSAINVNTSVTTLLEEGAGPKKLWEVAAGRVYEVVVDINITNVGDGNLNRRIIAASHTDAGATTSGANNVTLVGPAVTAVGRATLVGRFSTVAGSGITQFADVATVRRVRFLAGLVNGSTNAAGEVYSVTVRDISSQVDAEARITSVETVNTTQNSSIASVTSEVSAARQGEASLSAKMTAIGVAYAAADSVLAGRATTLEAQMGDTAASGLRTRISTEETTRASADSALATRATTLESQMGNTAASGIQSRISTEESTRASADSALASRATTLEAQMNNTTASALQSRISTEEGVRASADSTLAGRATTLESQMNNTAASGLQSRISTEESTRASADSALATRASTLEARSFVKGNLVRGSRPNLDSANPNNLFARFGWQNQGLWNVNYSNFVDGPFLSQSLTAQTNYNWFALNANAVPVSPGVAVSAQAMLGKFGTWTAGTIGIVIYWYSDPEGTTLVSGATNGVVQNWEDGLVIQGQNANARWVRTPNQIAPAGAQSCRLGVYTANATGNGVYTEAGAWMLKLEYGSTCTAWTDEAMPLEIDARVRTEESARASADSALATRATTLEARFSAPFVNLVRNSSGEYGVFAAGSNPAEGNWWLTDTAIVLGIASAADTTGGVHRFLADFTTPQNENFYSVAFENYSSNMVFGGSFYNNRTAGTFQFQIFGYTAGGAPYGAISTRDKDGNDATTAYVIPPTAAWTQIERRVIPSDIPSGCTHFRIVIQWVGYTGYAGFTRLQGHYGTVLPPFSVNTGDPASVNARIVAEESTRATADSALAARATNLEATVNNGTTGVAATAARLTTEESTRASADSALASRSTVLEAVARTRGDSVLPDPDMRDTAWWTGGVSGVNLGDTAGDWRRNRYITFAVNGSFDVFTPYFPVQINATYRIRVRIWNYASGWTGAFWPLIHMPVVAWYSLKHGYAVNPDVADAANAIIASGDTGELEWTVTNTAASGNVNRNWQFRFKGLNLAAASPAAVSIEIVQLTGWSELQTTEARVATEESARASADSALAFRSTTLEAIASAGAPGANLVPNSALTSLDGYEYAVGGTGPFARGLNLNNDWSSPQNPTGYINVSRSTAVGSETVIDERSPRFRVNPSQNYGFAARLAPHRATASVRLEFLDASGAYINNTSLITGGTDGGAGNGVPSTLATVGGFTTSPSNAVFGRVVVRLAGNGEGDPYLFWQAMDCFKASQGQTALRPYQDGPPLDRTADLVTTTARIATEESARASADNALASRSTTLEAVVRFPVPEALNKNPTFATWTGASGTLPEDWSNWSNSFTNTKETGDISPFAYRQAKTAGGTNWGILQNINGVLTQGWYVLEADIRLNSGVLNGAGAYIQYGVSGITDSVSFGFWSEPDVNGTVHGAGTAGRRYRWAKLVQIINTANLAQIYAMTSWDGFSDTAGSTRDITWHKCLIRPASDSEIELRAARNGAASVGARITTEESARASGDSANASLITTLTARSYVKGNLIKGSRPNYDASNPNNLFSRFGWLFQGLWNVNYSPYVDGPYLSQSLTSQTNYTWGGLATNAMPIAAGVPVSIQAILGKFGTWTTGTLQLQIFWYSDAAGTTLHSGGPSKNWESGTVIAGQIPGASARWVDITNAVAPSGVQSFRLGINTINATGNGSYTEGAAWMLKAEYGTTCTTWTDEALASENDARVTSVNSVAVDGRGRAYAISGTQTEVNGRKGGFVMDNDGVVTNFQITADDFRIYQSVGGSSIVPFRVFGGQTQINDALIRTLSVIPDGGGPSHRVQLRPNSLSGADGASFTFSPAYGGIPLIRPVVLQPPALAAGETYDISATSLSASGFTVRAKKFSAGTPTAQSSGAGSNVGGTPAWQAAKPTSADADGNSYTYSWTATLPRVSNEFMGSNQYYAEYEGEFDVYYDAGSGWVYAYSTYLSFASFYTGSSPSTVTGQAGATTAVLPAIGQHGGNEFGLHAISGTITAFAGVSYTTTSQSSVAALPGNFTFDIYPPT